MKNNILLLFVSIVLTLVAGEILLRVFTPFPGVKIEDPELGYRTSSKAEGVGADGFRNAAVQPPYEMVAIGDSHTYGFNVKAQDNWPSIVGRALNKNVRNLSAGGYGIIHHLALFNLALKDHPQTIVLGFYPYNDLKDTCDILSSDYWRTSAEQWELQTAYCASGKDSKKKPQEWEVSGHFLAWTAIIEYVWHKYVNEHNYVIAGRRLSRPNSDWIEFKRHIINAQSPPYQGNQQVLEAAPEFQNMRTIFSYMDKTAKKQGIRFIVLFIPSRELVVYTVAQQAGSIPQKLEDAVKDEQLIRSLMMRQFNEQGIEYTDALPDTAKAFSRAISHKNIFYPDSHPVKAGYQAYAESLLRYMRSGNAQ